VYVTGKRLCFSVLGGDIISCTAAIRLGIGCSLQYHYSFVIYHQSSVVIIIIIMQILKRFKCKIVAKLTRVCLSNIKRAGTDILKV